MEWPLWFQGIEKLFVIVVAVIGYLIKRALAQQLETNERLERKINAILEQVRDTNGRVGRLEEWKVNHTREMDGIHDGLGSQVRALWDRLNRHLDGGSVR